MKIFDILKNLFTGHNRTRKNKRGRKKQHFKISLFKKIGIKIREIIDIVFPILVILIGCGVTVYLHYHRFTADGNLWYIASLFGAGLTFLIAVLSMLFEKRRTKPMLLLLIMVMAYSILSTSAGQTISLQRKHESETSVIMDESRKILDDQISRLEKDISELSIKINDKDIYLTAKKREFNDKYDYVDYNRQVPPLEKELSKLTAEKTIKENELKVAQTTITDSNTVTITQKKIDIYEFYGSMISGKWSSRDWLVFGFHTGFSIIVELFIPFGIFKLNAKSNRGRKKLTIGGRLWRFIKKMFSKKRGRKPGITQPKKEDAIITEKDVRSFAYTIWNMRKNDKTDYFPKRFEIVEEVKKINPIFDNDKFETIVRRGYKNGLLVAREHRLYPVNENITSDVFIREWWK